MIAPLAPATPGIHLQALPSFPGGITGVPTSVAAFVGVTESGPPMQPTAITSWAAYQQQFGALAWRAMVSWSVYEFFREGGGVCYVVRVADLAGATSASTSATARASQAVVTAITPGTWGNSLAVLPAPVPPAAGGAGAQPTAAAGAALSVLADATAPDALLQDYARGNNLAAQVLGGKSWFVLEQFTAPTAADLAGKVNSQSIFVRMTATATGAQAAGPGAASPVPLAGGSEVRHDFGAATALLDQVPDVSLLSVPDIVTATDLTGQPSLAQQAGLINAGLLYCQNRGSVFYVVDAPAGLDVPGILSFKTGAGKPPGGNPSALSNDYGALYYPWVFVYNAATGANVPIPPSGPVLGRYAWTDAQLGVFKAPAGTMAGALQSVTMLEQVVSTADQGLLNPAGVNCIRSFPVYGNLIWGARTLSPSQEWTYTSIRRTLIYIEQSIRQSLQWAVFEPDNAMLWVTVTRAVTAFLTGLWQQGGLMGATAHDAFFVICDASNNPPEAILVGQLNVDIGVALVYPAEFVVLRIQQQTATAAQ